MKLPKRKSGLLELALIILKVVYAFVELLNNLSVLHCKVSLRNHDTH
jgi:hypothetical protein